MKLDGVIFNYDGGTYLAHGYCAETIQIQIGWEVVIIGPVSFKDGDKCAYTHCEVA
jgi:hypothetical protein